MQEVIGVNLVKNKILRKEVLKKVFFDIPTYFEIKRNVCNFFNLTIEQVLCKSRKRELVYARQIIMAIIHIIYKKSLQQTGDIFGKDHSTVLHSKKTVKNLIDTDFNYKQDIINICNLLHLDFDYVYNKL